MSRGSILVIRGGAIGDFILTLPAIAALRKAFPVTRIEVLGYPHIASLGTLGLGVADVKSIESGALAGFFARRGKLDERLGAYFGGFNIIVSYLYDPDLIFQENVGRCTKAQFIAGPYRPNDSAAVHATEVFLQPLERLAIFGADPIPRLNVGEVVQGDTLAAHPGSGSEKKNWPESRWAELLDKVVRETRWRVMLVGGEAEMERVQRLSSIVPVDRLTVMMNQPLTEVAKRLAGCRAFVGHDSGITHLAAAVGLPGVALWGGSNPDVWRPRSNSFQILREPQGLDGLQAGTVFGALNGGNTNA